VKFAYLSDYYRGGSGTCAGSFTIPSLFSLSIFGRANPDPPPARDVPPVINPAVRQLDYNFARSLALVPVRTRAHISERLINARRSRDERERYLLEVHWPIGAPRPTTPFTHYPTGAGGFAETAAYGRH